jgi:PAS domain S-box-containing protein/putative nucleotidyltransferase with HDIG domain
VTNTTSLLTRSVSVMPDRELEPADKESLQHGLSIYRTLVELSPDAIVLVAPTGLILLANAQAVSAHGFASADELLGRNLFELVAHEEHQRAMTHLGCAVELGSIRNIEHQLLRVDGSSFPAELSVAVIRDAVGQPQAFIAIVRDITERKQTQMRIEHLLADVQRTNADLIQTYDTTLAGWAAALDLRDEETHGHSQRVTQLTVRLARAMGQDEEEIVQIRRGALLHDIGKMGIPDAILSKPGALTDEEWTIMRRHPEYANQLLAPITFLQPALSIPYYHHEKWDGTGYPCGLQGAAIPLSARLFAVVDVYDALRSNRPYRAGWPEERVRAHIRAQAGSHFDPAVVQAFLDLEDVEAMAR